MNKATVTSNNEEEKQDMNNDNLAYLNGFVSQHFHNLKKITNKYNIEIRKDAGWKTQWQMGDRRS